MKIKEITQGFPLLMRYANIRKPDSIKEVNNTLVDKKTKKKFKTRFFIPKGRHFPADSKGLPGIYLQHGMSVRGIEDQRIINLARNLADCGFVVMTPELQEVKELKMLPDTIENITICFDLFSQQKDIVNTEKLGYASASFSAGMGFISMTDKRVADKVKSLLLIGSYLDYKNTLPYVIGNFHIDQYAVLVCFYNYIDWAYKNVQNLKAYLFKLAVNDSLRIETADPETTRMYNKLSAKEKEILKKIQEDEAFRNELYLMLSAKIPKKLTDFLSPIHYVNQMKAPVSLLHGMDDPVISPTESEKLSALLRQSGLKSKLLTTGILTHGDNKSVYSQILEVPYLCELFGHFFIHLK